MGGRIAALALGRRSRWVVIAAWVLLAVALAPLQPRLQTLASDESETFFARGADSTTVDRLLDTRFPEGGDATAVIAFSRDARVDHTTTAARSGRPRTRSARASRCPALKGVGSPAGAGLRRARAHARARRRAPSPFSTDDPPSTVLFSVVNGRDDTESVAADVAALRKLLPGPDGRTGCAATSPARPGSTPTAARRSKGSTARCWRSPARSCCC